jgi:hypothetical protein
LCDPFVLKNTEYHAVITMATVGVVVVEEEEEEEPPSAWLADTCGRDTLEIHNCSTRGISVTTRLEV